MKSFKTSDMNIVETCQQNFLYHLPSDILYKRTKNFFDNIIYYRKLVKLVKLLPFRIFIVIIVLFSFLYHHGGE